MKIEQAELSIYDVEKLHKSLVSLYKEGSIILDIANVENIDMSIVQLFVSGYKSCLLNDKKFELQNINDEVQSIILECACGFLIGVASE